MGSSTNRTLNATYLREAIRLSSLYLSKGHGGPFGAVVVRQGEIIGRGWNQVLLANDPTAHAEIMAIRQACQKLQRFSLAGCEIYSSCEPCPMCHAAILWARLEGIYYAASGEDAAAAGFDDRDFHRQLAKSPEDREVPMVQGLQEEARQAFAIWQQLEDRVAY